MNENISRKPIEEQPHLHSSRTEMPQPGNVFSNHWAWFLILLVACLVITISIPPDDTRQNFPWTNVLGRVAGMFLGGLALAGFGAFVFLLVRKGMTSIEFMCAFTIAIGLFMASHIFLHSSSVNPISEKTEVGDPEAQYRRWRGYLSQTGPHLKGLEAPYPKNAADATNQWIKAALKGNVAAQYNLGHMFETGDGVETNCAEATKWFLMAANQGDTASQCRLGEIFENGSGAPRDPAEAYKWYNISAAKGAPFALWARERLSRSLSPDQLNDGQRRSTEFFERTRVTANVN